MLKNIYNDNHKIIILDRTNKYHTLVVFSRIGINSQLNNNINISLFTLFP